ncbi:helix-turn-helix transcriptional regulator [Clostridium sp. ZBS4]|uniref:helix-turn-helix domain-containing protein n=1 Tax=Clostridium sp. ZBS4 TaxID=2949974 RepID=UPI00207973F0|nr:helix-turn-helix transcriptional regulator [Clostridium sp. ZBS4]
MIGLEYVLKLWNITQQELADKLEIKQQNIDSWIKGKRKIPKKHLPKLVEIFNLPEEYFQKKLNDVDKLTIQQMKIRNEWITEEYEEEAYDPITGEYERDKNGNIIMIKRIATDRGQEQYYEMLKYEIDEAKLINRLKQTLSEIFYKAQINENYIYGDELTEAYSILNLYELFIKILEKGGVSRSTLRNILTGISNYQKKDFENNNNNDLAVKITNIIKDEEDRLRKEAKYWLEMSKGMDDLL